MKIIHLTQFLKMPEGTLFSKFDADGHFHSLCIRGVSYNGPTPKYDGWKYVCIEDAIDEEGEIDSCEAIESAVKKGTSLKIDLNYGSSDSGYEKYDGSDNLFAVWEKADVEMLIEKLKSTL